MLGLSSNTYQQNLKEWFGRNWLYHLRPLIQSVMLPEYYDDKDSRASIRTAWLVAVNEREHRRYTKSKGIVVA